VKDEARSDKNGGESQDAIVEADTGRK